LGNKNKLTHINPYSYTDESVCMHNAYRPRLDHGVADMDIRYRMWPTQTVYTQG